MSIRMRHTRGHTGNRRSHHALKNRVVVADKASGALRLPHRLDETTGMYRGRLIIEKKVKQEKSKAKAGKMSEKEHEHVREIERAEEKKNAGSKGLVGKLTGGAKPKARSGAGGGGA